jgi:D-alanyl-D-alanine carboxypeptidase
MRVSTTLAAILLATLAVAGPAAAGPALLFDASDGKILYAEEMDDQWHPASLTKIMTAYMAFKAIKAGKIRLDDKVVCTQLANQQPPSKIGLPIGGELTVELALQALIVKSANDVAVMLAEKISGSELQFVADMNATARELGMTRTQFSNANGLPAFGQVTTARDLAKLARAVSAEFPEYSPYWAMTQMRIGKIRLSSHNGLLKTFEGADGLKTGFICDSGFNVVASATRDGRRLMAVVLGEPSGGERNIRAASLLEHGFQQLGWKQIFNQATIDNLPVPPDARGPISVRSTIQSWDCGNGKRNPAVEARRERIKAAKAKREKAKKSAAEKSALGGANPGAEVGNPPSGTPAAKKPSAAGTPEASAPVKKSPSLPGSASAAP